MVFSVASSSCFKKVDSSLCFEYSNRLIRQKMRTWGWTDRNFARGLETGEFPGERSRIFPIFPILHIWYWKFLYAKRSWFDFQHTINLLAFCLRHLTTSSRHCSGRPWQYRFVGSSCAKLGFVSVVSTIGARRVVLSVGNVISVFVPIKLRVRF